MTFFLSPLFGYILLDNNDHEPCCTLLLNPTLPCILGWISDSVAWIALTMGHWHFFFFESSKLCLAMGKKATDPKITLTNQPIPANGSLVPAKWSIGHVPHGKCSTTGVVFETVNPLWFLLCSHMEGCFDPNWLPEMLLMMFVCRRAGVCHTGRKSLQQTDSTALRESGDRKSLQCVCRCVLGGRGGGGVHLKEVN